MARRAVLAVVCAAVIWATGGPTIKVLLQHGVAENDIFFIKGFFCLLSMLLCNLLFRKRMARLRSWKDLLLFLLCGVGGYLFYGMCYGYAVRRIPISIAVVLVYTAPAIVTLCSVVFLRERLTAVKKISLRLMMAGCICVTGVWQAGVTGLSGAEVLWGLASGCCFAVYSMTSAVLMRRYDAWTVATYNFIPALLAAALLADVPQAVERVASDPSVLLLSAYFGVFCGTVSNLIYVWAMEFLSVSTASMLTTIEPVATCIMGVLFFREGITGGKVLGVVCIVLAVILLNRQKAEGGEKAAKEEAAFWDDR